MAKIEWVKIRVLREIFIKGMRRGIVIFGIKYIIMEQFNPGEEFDLFLKPYKNRELTKEFLILYHDKLISLLQKWQTLGFFSQSAIAVMILEADSYMSLNMKEDCDLRMIKMMLDSFRFDFLRTYKLNLPINY